MYHKMQTNQGAVTAVAWQPRESSKVVTAGLDGTLKYWD
jgi:pre-mRNA-processing factor 17